VPEKWHALWQQGLDSKQFYLKLCGAGGGGFLLGIALYDFEKIPSILQPYLSQITWA
jgi:mevalonate kinase